jgi:hypothetical protein
MIVFVREISDVLLDLLSVRRLAFMLPSHVFREFGGLTGVQPSGCGDTSTAIPTFRWTSQVDLLMLCHAGIDGVGGPCGA